MDERLKKLAGKAAGFWKGLSKPKQFGLLAGLVALLVTVALITSLSTATHYELLYSGGLTSTEAAQVYKAVQGKGVAVKVSGDAIYVKKGTADALRMELAESGLPQGNLPYDVYSSSGNTWAETDQDRNIKNIQQDQNRLQDSICTITGVRQAIVTVAQGNSDTYVLESDSQPTTASVVVTMQPGYELTQGQVNAIIQMVAHGVPGLLASNVAVTDENGSLLSGSGGGDSDTASQFQLQTQYENTVKAKALSLLNQIYGKGNVDVAVTANLDFSKQSTVTTSYSSKGTPSSVTQSSSVTVNGGTASGGTVGTNGGQVTYPAASSGSGTVTSAASNSQTTYAVGSVQQQIEQQGGRLQKLSVAVILNSGNSAAASANTATLRQTLANALGTDANNISVSQMGFSSVSSAPASSGAATVGLFPLPKGNAIFLYAAIGALVVLAALLALVLTLLRRRRKKAAAAQQAELLAAMQATEAQKQAGQPGKPLPPGIPGKAFPPRPAVKSIEETIAEAAKDSVKSQIEEFADKKPELVAQILKNWLKD